MLWFLKRPVVYTVTAGVGPESRMPPTSFLRRLSAIVVPSRTDLDALTQRGLRNAHLIRPGIDLTRFTDAPVPPGAGVRPAVRARRPGPASSSGTKGVDALLEVARTMPDVRLVFLWRGVLLAGARRAREATRLSERVEILRDRVDVSQVLARVHAAVVLAGRRGWSERIPTRSWKPSPRAGRCW